MSTNITNFHLRGFAGIQSQIRMLAGTSGTRFAYWTSAKDQMRAADIEPQDITDALAGCVVVSMQKIGVVPRYLVNGQDSDGRLIQIRLVLGHELSILEVINVKLQQ